MKGNRAWLVAVLVLCVAASTPKQQSFATAEGAAAALVEAAEKYDVAALTRILGSDAIDLVLTQDEVQSRNLAHEFAAQARERMTVVTSPESEKRASLIVGKEDWPMPIPLAKTRQGWRFDTKAGRKEIRMRRIGGNELDAIDVCRGFVEAQHEYALVKRDGSSVNQYAKRILSTPGRQDGLAWQAPDGSWQGPVGEAIARVIAEGYTAPIEPYHGYYFKVLTGQGKHAPLGEMDFVVNGHMIGGFALLAAPADYGVTGIKTFMVSHDGVVYEKDLGSQTAEAFRKMERFDPDPSWKPVEAS